MASFQVKIGWKRPWMRENKIYRFVSFRSDPMRNRKSQESSKKIQKTGCEMPRKRENKNYCSVSFLHDT